MFPQLVLSHFLHNFCWVALVNTYHTFGLDGDTCVRIGVWVCVVSVMLASWRSGVGWGWGVPTCVGGMFGRVAKLCSHRIVATVQQGTVRGKRSETGVQLEFVCIVVLVPLNKKHNYCW